MNYVKRIKEFFNVWFALLFVWSGLASAGVPSPVPDPEAGPHTPEHQIANLGDFQFESGEVVKDFKVTYVTHGKLNENKDNVILAMHHALGDHHTFDFLIGPGKALDTIAAG
jgi:homoserine O-acetyltransferase